jgi:hypothetical protein
MDATRNRLCLAAGLNPSPSAVRQGLSVLMPGNSGRVPTRSQSLVLAKEPSRIATQNDCFKRGYGCVFDEVPAIAPDGGCCIKPSRKRCCSLAEVGARDAEPARVASRSWRVTNDLAIFGARPENGSSGLAGDVSIDVKCGARRFRSGRRRR